MKKIFMCAMLLSLAACKDKAVSKDLAEKRDALAYEIPKEQHKELYGIWTGTMEPVYEDNSTVEDAAKKITIKIDRIINNEVFGNSVASGNKRPLKGRLEEAGPALRLILEEPGDNRYDGKFEFQIEADKLVGRWTSFKQNPDVTSVKTMELVQKQFAYNPEYMLDPENGEIADYDNPKEQEVTVEDDQGVEETFTEDVYRIASDEVFRINASTTRLTEEALKNLRKLDLEIIRNTIFARHGYSFKKGSLRYFFEACSWYVPVSDSVDKELTALEKDNITLLKRMEKYAEDHYDTFGR